MWTRLCVCCQVTAYLPSRSLSNQTLDLSIFLKKILTCTYSVADRHNGDYMIHVHEKIQSNAQTLPIRGAEMQ